MSSRQMRPELVEGPTTHLSAGSGRIRRDRGQGTIEFMAMVPLVLAVLVCALQVMAQAYTAHAASQAARDGARAFSLGQSAAAAVSASLPGNVELLNMRPPAARTTPSRCVVQPPIRMIPFVTDYTDHPIGDHAMTGGAGA